MAVELMVPEEGVEPTRPCDQRILSPPRLPFRHSGMCLLTLSYGITCCNCAALACRKERGCAALRLTEIAPNASVFPGVTYR